MRRFQKWLISQLSEYHSFRSGLPKPALSDEWLIYYFPKFHADSEM